MVSTSMGMDDEPSLLHGYPKIYVEVCAEYPNVTSLACGNRMQGTSHCGCGGVAHQESARITCRHVSRSGPVNIDKCCGAVAAIN